MLEIKTKDKQKEEFASDDLRERMKDSHKPILDQIV